MEWWGPACSLFFEPLPLVLYLGVTPRDEQVSNNARLLKRYKMDKSRVSTLTRVITHLKREYSHMQSTSLLKWRHFKQKLIWFKYIQATIFFRFIRDTTYLSNEISHKLDYFWKILEKFVHLWRGRRSVSNIFSYGVSKSTNPTTWRLVMWRSRRYVSIKCDFSPISIIAFNHQFKTHHRLFVTLSRKYLTLLVFQ